MAHDRPSPGLLTFICDACADTFEITKQDEDLGDYKACWARAREDGWRMKDGEHYCTNCAEYL